MKKWNKWEYFLSFFSILENDEKIRWESEFDKQKWKKWGENGFYDNGNFKKFAVCYAGMHSFFLISLARMMI